MAEQNQSMAEQNQPITSLPIKTASGIAATDYLLGIDSAEGYQMLIQDLGDYIIQNATSLLAGQSQTLANAISGLDSNTYNLGVGTSISSGTDLDSVTTVGNYISVSGTITNSLSHCPITGYGFRLTVEAVNTTGVILQKLASGHNPSQHYERRGQVASNVWSFSEWKQAPNRDEVDTLNSNLGSAGQTEVDANTVFTNLATDKVSFTGVVNSSSNIPVPNSGSLMTIKTLPNRGYQMFFALNDESPYYRFNINGTWSSWYHIPTRTEITTLNVDIGTLSGIKTVVVNDTTSGAGIITLNVGTFTGRPYVISNISSDRSFPYRITCNNWAASTGTVDIRVRNSSDNAAIANTTIQDTILIIFSR